MERGYLLAKSTQFSISMKRLSILLIFICAANIAVAQPSGDSIKAIIKREVSNKRSKSIIVGIVTANGRQLFAEGQLSDTDSRLPDGNTMYEIGSITKIFTSLLLAEMSLKGVVNVNDPISKYLPKNVKVPIRNGKEISLGTLATHRSGMPRFPYNVDPKNLDDPYADYTVQQLYEYVSTFEPDVDFDTKWRYSNTAYGLLGNILSLVAHKDFETMVKENICKPLRMNSTVVSLTPKMKLNVATGYAETGHIAGYTSLRTIEGAGALRSNVNDLLTFAEANLGLTKTDLLPAINLTHVLQAKKDGNDDVYTTMGWTLINKDGRELLFKDGGTYGYRTFIGIDKKNKTGVVVLSNSNNSVTDIGWHFLDSTRNVETYKYPWALLDTLRTTIQHKDVAAAITLYETLKLQKNTGLIFNVNQLNYLGSELRRNKKIQEAIKIFQLNVKEYPTNVLVYGSLGETYQRHNNRTLAIECFEKAKELEPENRHWVYVLERLKTIIN